MKGPSPGRAGPRVSEPGDGEGGPKLGGPNQGGLYQGIEDQGWQKPGGAKLEVKTSGLGLEGFFFYNSTVMLEYQPAWPRSVPKLSLVLLLLGAIQ